MSSEPAIFLSFYFTYPKNPKLDFGGAAYQRCYNESRNSRAAHGARNITHTSNIAHTDSAMSILGRGNHSEISDVVGAILPRQILLTLSETDFFRRQNFIHMRKS